MIFSRGNVGLMELKGLRGFSALRAVAAYAWTILILAAALLGDGCERASTGGSETTNGLTGFIRDPEGNPAPHAQVALVPESYQPMPGADADHGNRCPGPLPLRRRGCGRL
jgi:hypothetical protein